jgi:hypothetical protein
VGYGSLSLPLKKQVRYKEYQKVAILSAGASPLCKCVGRHIKRFNVKLEVGALDKDVISIVNSYFMCGNWALVLETFDDKGVWNLIAHHSVTESFNSKAQNEKIVVVSQWMESKEVSPKTIWNSWINEMMSLSLSFEVRDLLYVYGIQGYDMNHGQRKFIENTCAGVIHLLKSKSFQYIAAKALIFLGFHFDNCYLIFEGECSFLSAIMEPTERLYATRNLRDDLAVSFSYSPKIILCCNNLIFVANDVVNGYGVVRFWENAEKSVFVVLNVFSLVSIFTIFDILNDAFVTAMIEMNLKCGHDSWIHKAMVPFMTDPYDLHFWKEMMAVYGRKLQPFILGAKVTQQPLVLSSFYVWYLFNKHIRKGLSTGCIYPKQE